MWKQWHGRLVTMSPVRKYQRNLIKLTGSRLKTRSRKKSFFPQHRLKPGNLFPQDAVEAASVCEKMEST